MTQVADLDAEGKAILEGDDKQVVSPSRERDESPLTFKAEVALASLSGEYDSGQQCTEAIPEPGRSDQINVDKNQINSSPIGTQGNVAYNNASNTNYNNTNHNNYSNSYIFFGGRAAGKDEQPADPTELTHKQAEDIPELNEILNLSNIEHIVLSKRVVIIEQDPNNHLLVSNIVRKLRFKWQSQYQMRDAQGVVDTTSYSKHCRYETPTITVLMPQQDAGTLLPLLHQDECERVRNRLVENKNHLIVVTQLNVSRLKQKVAPPVESDVHVWCPDNAATDLRECAQHGSLESVVEEIFQAELGIQPFIVFLLGFFPGLNLQQFNQIIHYWVDQYPDLLQEREGTKADDGEMERRTYTWKVDGDRLISRCQGAFTEDAGWGKGYYYQSPRNTLALQQFLITRHPNYCQQHFNDLLPLYLQSPDTWGRFQEHFKNTFLQFIHLQLHDLDHRWLIELYDKQRAAPNPAPLINVIGLLRVLSNDKDCAALVASFYQALAGSLLAKQQAWQSAIERTEHYNPDRLAEFQREVGDYFNAIVGSCGIAEDYIVSILLQHLEKSPFPFSAPFQSSQDDKAETVLCPLSWYAKYRIGLTFFADHSDYFAIVKRLLQYGKDKIDGKSPLAVRSAIYLCYFVAAKAIEENAHIRATRNNDADSAARPPIPAVIHDMLERCSFNEIFIDLILSQLNIVKELSSQGSYEKWLTHQLMVLENIALISADSEVRDADVYAQGLANLCNALMQQLPKSDARFLRVFNQERLVSLQDQYHASLDSGTRDQQRAVKARLAAVRSLRHHMKS